MCLDEMLNKIKVVKRKVPDKINPMLWMKRRMIQKCAKILLKSCECELEELLKYQLKKGLRNALRIQRILKI